MKAQATFWLICVAGLFLDLVSKALVFDRLGGVHGTHFEIIGDVLELRCAENPGGVFGVLPNKGYIFIPLSFVAMGVVYWFFLKTHTRTWKTVPPLALITAGTLGNLYDRLRLGHVRDFIDVFIGSYNWPTFNIADTWICTGAGILVLLLFIEESLQDPQPEKQA